MGMILKTAGNNSTNPRPVPQRTELAQTGELKVSWAEYLMVRLTQVVDHRQQCLWELNRNQNSGYFGWLWGSITL